jgi:hypothetical protein
MDFKTVAVWWAEWTILDWIWKYFLGAALLTLLGWMAATYQASQVQREIRGALIALTAMTILTMAIALLRRPILLPSESYTDSRDPAAKEADVIRDLALKGSFKVNIYCVMTETDSCHFAKKWMHILDTAGWKTGGLNLGGDFAEHESGLFVYRGDSRDSKVGPGEFELALRENAIPVSDQCPDPNFARDTNFDFALLVGTR